MVSIQGVKVAAIHTPLTRAPSSTVTEIRLLAAAKPSCRSRRSHRERYRYRPTLNLRADYVGSFLKTALVTVLTTSIFLFC